MQKRREWWDLKLYWPNAIILVSEHDDIGTDRISTYEGCIKQESAKAQIELWADGYVTIFKRHGLMCTIPTRKRT